jgi:hypothetical protein
MAPIFCLDDILAQSESTGSIVLVDNNILDGGIKAQHIGRTSNSELIGRYSAVKRLTGRNVHFPPKIHGEYLRYAAIVACEIKGRKADTKEEIMGIIGSIGKDIRQKTVRERDNPLYGSISNFVNAVRFYMNRYMNLGKDINDPSFVAEAAYNAVYRKQTVIFSADRGIIMHLDTLMEILEKGAGYAGKVHQQLQQFPATVYSPEGLPGQYSMQYSTAQAGNMHIRTAPRLSEGKRKVIVPAMGAFNSANRRLTA